jgi:branched-chain amino acid transport system permease protein
MTTTSTPTLSTRQRIRAFLLRAWEPYRSVPLLGWLIAALVAVGLENLVGLPLARVLGMSKIPALFGTLVILDDPILIPSALLFIILIYILPIGLIARLIAPLTNRIAAKLMDYPMIVTAVIHLVLMYALLHIWGDISDYRVLVARLAMISIILTLSLNVVNGYMGEFSCSHPGFMSVGAYVASAFTIVLFVSENRFGEALLPEALGPFMFPIGLILGGLVSAIGALLVAIPSFRTRGDYLAIISLAFMFIVKSLFENLEVVGGARGISNQPNYATLPIVFVWTVLSIWVINNFVSSTMGKALNAVRDGELAANTMTVNTRKTKMVAFLFAAFWAGVAGGLFAHVLRYINPDTFGIRKLAEVLAMVYLGGLNSVTGSIVGAVGLSLISEALRPLDIYKWIIIPIILILIMIFRPTGLVAFTDLSFERLFQPKEKASEGAEHASA